MGESNYYMLTEAEFSHMLSYFSDNNMDKFIQEWDEENKEYLYNPHIIYLDVIKVIPSETKSTVDMVYEYINSVIKQQFTCIKVISNGIINGEHNFHYYFITNSFFDLLQYKKYIV